MMRFSVCEPGGNAGAGDIGKGRLSGCERIGAGRCRRPEESPPPAHGPAEIREDCVRLQRGHMGKGLCKSKTKQYPAQK